MKSTHVVIGAALAALIISAASASGWVVPASDMSHPPERLGPIELRTHQVDTTIADQVATTQVEQVFFNPSNQRLEATYYFPLPREAHIDRFSMFIDGTEVDGEILDAKEARNIYENIVRQVKDPALLEYAGQGLVRIRVFPFEPKSERRIRIKYTQLLPQDNDVISYVLPIHTASRLHHRRLPQFSLRLNLTSTSSIKTIYSPTHDVEITRPADNAAIVGFESLSKHSASEFKLFYALDSQEDDVGLTLLTHRPDESEDGYFLLLASPSVSMKEEQVIAKDLVFVLDTSGSMARGKLEQAKNALHFCIDNLNPEDRFEIIRFATDTEPLFGSLAEHSEDALKRARDFIDALRPRGGTAIDDALQHAVKLIHERDQDDRPFIIVFLTDGRPTVGVSDEEEILKNVERQMQDAGEVIRVFSFGVGSDVNTYLLDRLSQQSRAVSEYVLASEDIEIKVSQFYSRISDPVLANLELAVEGAEGLRINRMHPGQNGLPDLFKGDQLVVLGRYATGGDAVITLQGKVRSEVQTFVTEGTFAEREGEHDFIPRLWATRRIGFLLDQIRQQGENEELRDEIAHLARAHGIVTPYTAYLILEDEERRGVPMAQRVVQRDSSAIHGGGGGGIARPQEAYDQMARDRTGSAATRASRSNTGMQQAWNVQQLYEANSEAEYGAGWQSQQTRVVRGRAFVQNGSQWVDTSVQEVPHAEIKRVEFDSDEYYDLLRQFPDAAAWLSVGRNVQILLGDTIYEIHES